MLAQAVMGSGTVVSGLAVGPNSPAAMNVVVAPGSIFQLSTVDATAYGSLAADTADALVKQGINIASTTLAITAPTTSGYSQNYLIEAALLEADGTPVVLPYYNASNPASPYLGPGNSGSAQNTVRAQTVQLQAKAGVPATTGTQTTPATDSGWVPLAVVTVAYGASSITSGNISVASGAPYVSMTLPQVPGSFYLQSQFSARPYHKYTQSGSQAAAANTSYTLASGTFTLPSFSKTGSFRLNIRAVVGLSSSTSSSGEQNFTTTISDGTNSYVGASWLLATNGSNSAGTTDHILSSATYTAGSNVTLTMSVATAAGAGSASWSLTGSYFEVFVEEA